MNKIDQIIEEINTDNVNDQTSPIYFEKGFTFLPAIFNKDYNQYQDWSLSVNPDWFLGLTTVVSVEVWDAGRVYRIKPTKIQKKALIKAYDAWYGREVEKHRATVKRLTQ